MCMTTFQEISDHMTCHNECSDVSRSADVYNYCELDVRVLIVRRL